MRITFIAPGILGNPSGGSRVIAMYAQRLYDMGHEVCLVHGRGHRPSWREKLRVFLREGRWPRRLRGRGPYLEQSTVPMIELESTSDFRDEDIPDADVVIATFWTTAEAVARLAPEKGAKAYFIQDYIIDYVIRCEGGYPVDRVKATWRLPMHKIVISNWLAGIAEKEYGDTDYSLVPNGVDLELFNALERGKQPVPTVGCMYSLARLKGIDVAINAVTFAQKKYPSLQSMWFGVSSVNAKLPLPHQSEYFQNPPQHTLKDIYGKCDAWIFPSRNDGFGLPILEAMACRTPVVGTPAGAAPELLGNGGGLLVEQDNPEAMAEAILDMVGLSDEEWRAVSYVARKTAESYDWQQAVTTFEVALKRAIARSRSEQQ